MKKTIPFAVAALFCMNAYSFEWPNANTEANSFSSEFGQHRGGVIDSSLVYKEPSEVFTTDEGDAIIVISEHGNEFGWFESTLGSSVIISHTDGLSTVYANLDEKTIAPKVGEKFFIDGKELLASSGDSAWQAENNGLEFKVYDVTNHAAVNPRLLMPRMQKELPLEMGAITFYDNNNVAHNVTAEKRLPSGVYSIYRTRQANLVPYKTIVSVNGTSKETIVFDTLKENSGKLGINGNGHYSAGELYPDNERQLLAKIHLAKGQNTITLTLMNFQETPVSTTYRLDIY